MTKRDYQRHIFARARGADSPVKDKAAQRYSGHWWQTGNSEKTLDEEYEQDAIVNERDGGKQQWTSSDASDREDFRNKQLEELRKQFRQNLRTHPGLKSMSAKDLGEIADAYLAGKDHDAFKSDEVKAALQEVEDFTTGDGEVAMSDDSTWRKNYPKQSSPAATPASTDPLAPKEKNNPVVNNGAVKNGTPQGAAAPQRAAATAPLAPRGQTTPVGTVSSYSQTRPASDTGVRVNGAPLDVKNNAGTGQLQRGQNESLRTDALKAEEARKNVQSQMVNGERRRNIERMEEDYDLSQRGQAVLDRRAADLKAKQEARQAQRVKDRKLSSRSDWEALGREANADNYNVDEAGIDEAEKTRRQGLVDKRNARVAGLREKIAAATDRTLIGDGETAVRVKNEDGSYSTQVYKTADLKGKAKNAAGGYDGVDAVSAEELSDRAARHTGVNSQWHYAGHVAGNNYGGVAGLDNISRQLQQGLENGTLSDAQIEAAEKNYGAGVSKADSGKAASEAFARRQQAERAAGLRKRYGMEDRSVFTDADVIAMHNETQAAGRKRVLEGAAPGTPKGDVYQGLLDSGWDPQKAFKDAMGDAAVLKDYQTKIRGIAADDPDLEQKIDMIKHSVALDQAYKDAGVQKQSIDAGLEELGSANQPEPTPEPTPQLTPQQTDQLTPRKKRDDEDETRQASKGGRALRPRRR